MKKQYSKPGIIIEDFKVSESIALPCSGVGSGGDAGSIGNATHADRSVCGWNVGGYVYWTGTNTGCNNIVGLEFEIDGYCYHNSTLGLPMFSSM